MNTSSLSKDFLFTISGEVAINTSLPNNSTWIQFEGNSLLLPVGVWELTGGIGTLNGGIDFLQVSWGTVNGDSLTGSPAPEFNSPNITVLALASGFAGNPINQPCTVELAPGGSDLLECAAPVLRVQVQSPTAIYLNSRVQSNTAVNTTYAKVSAYAKRIK